MNIEYLKYWAHIWYPEVKGNLSPNIFPNPSPQGPYIKITTNQYMNPKKHSQQFNTFWIQSHKHYFQPQVWSKTLTHTRLCSPLLKPHNQNNDKTKKTVFLRGYKIGTLTKNELTKILEPNIPPQPKKETKALTPRKYHNLKDWKSENFEYKL